MVSQTVGGYRSEGDRIRALMDAHYGNVNIVFVECVVCNARAEFTGAWDDLKGRMSDEEAARRFTEEGWHVEAGNVRCPKHHVD